MADFDVIVVGSGMSGGWVAKEMAEKGFKVCVIERGREISPMEDYTDMVDPWDTPDLDKTSDQDRIDFPVQSEVYAFNQNTRQYWVNDNDHPYEVPAGQSYKWRRGYHMGGRSIMWARQSYRMSEIDFEANSKDGHGVDWPVRTADIAPWYEYVEKFAGISGSKEGLEILPDSVFQPAHDLTCGEEHMKDAVESQFPGRRLIPGRCAHLTEPTQEQLELGRGKCQARSVCERGCSFGAYFSAVSATLPAAKRTGNMTLMADRIVQKVNYDPQSGRATGVQVVNAKDGAGQTVTARVIFMNASTIGTSMILLNSKSDSFQNGLANSSGQLGHNLMDHVSGARGYGTLNKFMDKYHYGRRPNGFYIPRFRNHTEDGVGFVRGYGYQGNVMRQHWRAGLSRPGIGADLKEANRTPGPWVAGMIAFAEVLPNFDNHVRLHESKTDKWGMAVPIIDAKNGPNELALIKQATRDVRAMLEAAGFENIGVDDPESLTVDDLSAPGNGIHEMGTARMGRDPKTSVLNKWNQSWDVPNLFITDGSFMTSGGCQNPSLTYMAFSARAANHAAELMKQGVI